MSTVFKKLSKSDISIIPFTAHKQSRFTSASLGDNKGNFYSSSFPTVSYKNGSGFEWAGSGSTDDPNNHKKYFQLDHLFYRNSKLDYINKSSKIKYYDHYRILHNKVNILSLPYKTIGYKIKTESFYIRQNSIDIKDDGNGHLYDAKYGTYSLTVNDNNFKNEKFRTFYLGPQDGHKNYDLSIKDGKQQVNFNSFYSKAELLDDSVLFNEIEYISCSFSSTLIDGGEYPVIILMEYHLV